MAYTGRYYPRSQVQYAAGTVATPLANAAYECGGISKPVEVAVARNGDLLTGVDQITPRGIAARYMKLDLWMPVSASATDDAPYMGALLRACGMSEATGGTTPNIAFLYRLARNTHLLTDSTPGSLDPIDLIVNYDGLEYALDSCAGNAKFEWKQDSWMRVLFSFVGIVDSGVGIEASAATEAAAETLTASLADVACINEAVKVKIGSAATLTDLEPPEMSFDCGNKIRLGKSLNGVHGFAAPGITSRAPKFMMSFAQRELTNYNFPSAATAHSKLTIEGTHNAAGGVGKTVRYGWRGYLDDVPDFPDDDDEILYALAGTQSAVSGDEFYIGWKSTADHTYPFD